MRSLLVLLLSCTLLLLMSCKSTEPDVAEEFSLQIKLTNTAGTPLEGYKITIFQKDFAMFWPGYEGRPVTQIKFSTQDNCRVQIAISDYFNNHIRNLVDQQYPMGTHVILWDSKNDAGDVIRDGIYKIRAKYYDPEDRLLFSDLFLAYKLGEQDAGLSPYCTDSTGTVQSTDITAFPILYCHDSIRIYDDNAEFVRYQSFTSSSDSMKVVITAPDETSRSHYFRINKSKNILNLNWDMLQAETDKNPGYRSTAIKPTHMEPLTNPKHPADDLSNKLHCCFPNPFN